MAREFRLRKSPWSPEGEAETGQVLDRRQFIRYSFNSAAGVITAISLGAIGFASLLMGESGGGGGDSEIRFWVPKGSEDSVWYGDQHLESMTESGFKEEAGRSTTGMYLGLSWGPKGRKTRQARQIGLQASYDGTWGASIKVGGRGV